MAQPFKLDYATLRRLPAVEVTKTLECISNFVGKPELAPFGAELISTAVWKGVAVRDILGLTGGPTAAAAWAVAFGADEFTSALPLVAVMDPATLVVYEMNGDVLPRDHGYPARLLVPDRYGMKSPKWLTGLRLMRNEYDDWFGQRSWSKAAIVQYDVQDRQSSTACGARVRHARGLWRCLRRQAGNRAGRIQHRRWRKLVCRGAEQLEPGPGPMADLAREFRPRAWTGAYHSGTGNRRQWRDSTADVQFAGARWRVRLGRGHGSSHGLITQQARATSANRAAFRQPAQRLGGPQPLPRVAGG